MSTKPMNFRFNKEIVRLAQEKAKAQRRSFNNYLEWLMLQDIGRVPNEETTAAIEETQSGKPLETITNLEAWLEDL